MGVFVTVIVQNNAWGSLGSTSQGLTARTAANKCNLIVFKSAKEFDEAGSTAVHKAAANGHLDVLKLLIQHGGDVELADISGCTPLHVAARNGHLTCVKYLVLQGADFRMKSKKGNTAMVMAKANNQPKVAEYLSNCGELNNDQFESCNN